MPFDWLIRGGLVVDGTGAPPWRADIGVAAETVAAVGRLSGAEAVAELDASGLLVLPGFVDAHSHADIRVLDDDVQLALLRQGVTTVVTGQDGVSFAPGSAHTTAWAGEYFAGINGPPDPAWAGLILAGYRSLLDRRTRVNTAHLLPHGTLRYEVAGHHSCLASKSTHLIPHILSNSLNFADRGDAASRGAVCHRRPC